MKLLKWRVYKSFLLKVAVTTAVFVLTIFVALLLRDPISEVMRWILGSAYYPILSLRYVVIGTAYAVCILFIIFHTISTATRYLEQITQSVDVVFNKQSGYIELPEELKLIENKLNHIKYTSLENERLAKEAEQRKNDLVVYLAHDLKTPLTSIIGYLTLLEEASDLSVEQRAKYSKITLDKAYRLEELINEFFDITRFNLQHIELEKNKVNLTRMLVQIIDEFYPMLQDKQLNVQTSFPDNLQIYCDADKIARVFDNLLRNAVNYSYGKTTIDIAIIMSDTYVQVSFKNQGDEIPQQKLDMIFEKFFRMDSARQTKTGGAGLGLAIAKQIVEQHRGTIAATSNMQATEFIVTLPLQL